MDQEPINAVFRPKPSKQEVKADATTQLVRQIMDGETAAREAKTERLRRARLARDSGEIGVAAITKPKATRRKKV